MISQDEIDAIKQGVDLVPFMKVCGIELKQVGGNYRDFCPFHEDTTPSLTVNPKENLWNCFGCNVSFRQACLSQPAEVRYSIAGRFYEFRLKGGGTEVFLQFGGHDT